MERFFLLYFLLKIRVFISTEAYSERCQTSRIELLEKIVIGWKSLTVFVKEFILDVWQSSEYVSVSKKIALKNFKKFTGKYLFQSLFFNKVAVAGLRSTNLLKKRLWHRCFPVKFVKFLRTPSLQNIFGRLLLSASGIVYSHTGSTRTSTEKYEKIDTSSYTYVLPKEEFHEDSTLYAWQVKATKIGDVYLQVRHVVTIEKKEMAT